MTSTDAHKHWAVYLQMTKVLDPGTDYARTARRQMIILPALPDAPMNMSATEYRIFIRQQRNLDEKSRWTGPFGRDLERMKATAAHYIRDWEQLDFSDLILVTVPVNREEVMNLRYEGKKTEYRVIDRARRVIKKKYKKTVR